MSNAGMGAATASSVDGIVSADGSVIVGIGNLTGVGNFITLSVKQ